MNKTLVVAALSCAFCWGQPADECKPSSLNIPEARYPCVYPDHRAMFRVINGAPGAAPTKNSPAISCRLSGRTRPSNSASAAGTIKVASTSPSQALHSMRRIFAITSAGRRLIPTDSISTNTATGTMYFMCCHYTRQSLGLRTSSSSAPRPSNSKCLQPSRSLIAKR